jgi:hypothetical protein
MATQTDKLAPRILVNENDIESKVQKRLNKPITLMFGFAPIGRTCEMVVCNNANDILTEFGSPESAPEKYFIDSALRLVQSGATALMTRLPYDNDQSHTVKYIDFKVGEEISMGDIATVPMETKTRQKDDRAVTVLKEMHSLDKRMTNVQRISQVYDKYGDRIHSMTNEELIELELDPQDNLDANTFRIVDIRGQRYGVGAAKTAYTGIFPMVVSAPMALYYQGKILNTPEMDKTMEMMDITNGIEMSTYWYKHADPIDDETKEIQAEIATTIEQELNFNTKKNRFHRTDSFQDACAKKFPNIGLAEKGKLEKAHLKEVGILICGIQWDSDQQKTNLVVLESYVGPLSGRGSIDRAINTNSKLVRMYKNVSIPVETDFFVINDQKIASLGMDADECQKYINYKTSIIDPLTYVLESIYSDVDSLELDVILDSGLTATAFAAYVAKNDDGETFFENNQVRTKIDWSKGEYPPEDYIEQYAKVWNEITRLFGDFIKSTRGDCVYIADGPRILNLERNYPIRNYTDMENVEMFNKFLPLFNGYTNNYVARYWNWVYIEDMQWINRGIWVPGSVVMGSQLAVNDKDGEVWYAPAGQNRGLVDGAFDVSVKTKTYNSENDLLYSNHWNFFNIYQNEGVVVEGQKTLQTKKTALDRLNVRRLVCYIKQQARIIANRYKYEPHTKSAREGFTSEILAMLQEIQKTSGISDYKVVCDDTNNTIESIDRHELWCKIAVKPIKAIEYIIIDLDIINGKVDVNDGNSVVLKS